jgi:hypothetical protein
MSQRSQRWIRPLLAGLTALSVAACVPDLTPTPSELAPAAQATSAPTAVPAVAPTSAPVPSATAGAPSPGEAIRAFYGWYLEYSRPNNVGEFRNPLVDGAYASSPYVTESLSERVADIVASFDRGGYDPFLCAQDVPTAFTVGTVEGDGTQAHARVYTTFVGHAFDVTVVHENGGWLLDEVTCANPDATARAPEDVVYDFYQWYVHYPGYPLVDQVYQGAGLFLTPGFIEQVSATVTSFDKGGYDPILLAQDVPTSVTIASATVDGGLAQVRLRSDLMGHELAVLLQRDGDIWRIAGVTRGGDEQTTGPVEVAETPEDAIRAFYGWYLEYSRPTDGGAVKNPLVDEQYAASPYLTAALVERVRSIVASFDKGGYDPFLCAQDVPTAFTVARAEGDGARVQARVFTSFVGHSFDVSLVRGDAGWQLDEVTCANPDPTARRPEDVVTDFYAWYVHYPGNPLADEAYRGAGLFLTQDFIEKVADTVASFDKGGFDPILLAQDVPETVVAEPAVIDGDTATVAVSTSFEGHTFVVRLVKDDPIWKIDGVARDADTLAEAGPRDEAAGAVSDRDDWQVYRLEHYTVQVMYPGDWVAMEARIQDPQSVRPIVHVTTFGSKGIDGRQMLASLEISEGTLDEVLRVCSLEADAVETVEVAGRTMRVGTSSYDETFYILQSPGSENVWAVLRDSMNWAGELSESDRALKDAIVGMVETLAFGQ